MTADLGPAATLRPVPSPEDRMRDARTDTTDRTFAAYLTAQERDQLDARAATAEQERDDALQDRDDYREARDVLRQQRDRTLADLTDAGNEVDQLTVDNARLRAELGAAQELIAVYDDVTEQLDRARAAYATRQGGTAPRLGSPPPRAQDDGGTVGYEIVARALHRDGLGALVSGDVVASAVSTRPTLAEAVDELRRAIGPAEREG